MNSQRWLQIEALYYSALPLAEPERAHFLATQCGTDNGLRDEVSSLLHADQSADDFLQNPMVDLGLKILFDRSVDDEETHPVDQKPPFDGLEGTIVDGRYQIVAKLGSGGVGDVYRARDTKILFRTVVIKVLQNSAVNRSWIVTKFEQEMEALTKIADPGVVGIIDAGKLPDGRRYLVMEFVEGSNLREFIIQNSSANGRLELCGVAEIMKQVGRAVTSAHDAGVVHRDLKPANIMVRRNTSGDLQVKVIDFGVSKIANSFIDETTSTGLIAGTVVYMAPEQLDGRKIQPESDVYALGVIAYELVTGNRPFNPESQAMLPSLQLAGVKVAPKDLRPALPAAAQEVILKALSYHPADRYHRARDFGDSLAEALNAVEPAAPDGSLSTKQSRVSRSYLYAEESDQSRGAHTKTVIRLAALGLVTSALCLTVFFAIRYIRSASSLERSLGYSLTVQRFRDGKEYKEPFPSSGREIFDTGDKFRLRVTSSNSGYLYVFNEGGDEGASISFSILFPTPSTNNGSANVKTPNFQTHWNTFEGRQGTEEFWIVWSTTPIPQLEAARDDAFKHEGEVSNVALTGLVRDFLKKNLSAELETTQDPVKQETVVRTNGELIVKFVGLEHH